MLDLGAALKAFGTPLYVYDQRRIAQSIARFSRIQYEDKAIHFASMANDNPVLLRLLRDATFGVFVNSLKHLAVAAKAGFTREQVIYTTTGLGLEDMRKLAKSRIALNLDSIDQVAMYGALAPGSEVGIRLNVDENSKINTYVGQESRIGVLESEFDKLHRVAREANVKLVGTHVYLGTDIVSEEQMITGTLRTLELSDRFPDLAYVDLGGGFPSPVEAPNFDYERYGARITEVFEAYSKKRGRRIKLILEPGRALFADSGYFCTRVLEIKERPDRLLVACDASVSIFPRPLIYGAYHYVDVHGKGDRALRDVRVDVVGSTTYSRDFLAKEVRLPDVGVGDVLVFHGAGSYCYSMLSRFLGQHFPAEVLVAVDGTVSLIREREGAGGDVGDWFPASSGTSRIAVGD